MEQPLSGIRVIDLSAVISGPMATGILADQGADVIKIETNGGDLARRVGPAKGDLSALFVAINRGKRSIVLDLKQASARQVLRELVASADVFIENFRPGSMARLGLSYEEVSRDNPKIIYLSISGFGQTGPYAGRRAYDPVIQAASGFAAVQKDTETGQPKLLHTLVCDKVAALTAAQAVTAALLKRERTGKGQKIELSMLDAAVSFLWPDALYNHSFLDEPPPALPEFSAYQQLWRCRDGWFAMITPQNEEFAALCEGFGVPDLIRDPRFATPPARRQYQRELRGILEPIAAERRLPEFVAHLVSLGVPAAEVIEKDRLHEDAQVKHAELMVEHDYPDLGRIRAPRAPARFVGIAGLADRPAPHLGEHSLAILSELGRNEKEADAVLAAGAVSQWTGVSAMQSDVRNMKQPAIQEQRKGAA